MPAATGPAKRADRRRRDRARPCSDAARPRRRDRLLPRAASRAARPRPIDALVAALAARGHRGAADLRREPQGSRVARPFSPRPSRALPPAIVLNTTAFAVSRIGAAHEGTVLDRPGRPVLQVVLAGSSEAAWRDSPRGLLPRDLTMNVVLPEVDGRLLDPRRLLQGGARRRRRTAGHDLSRRSPTASPSSRARRRPGCGSRPKPAKERRVAIILSNYPNRDGRIANGVGLDTPESAVAARPRRCARPATTLPGFPETSAALMAAPARRADQCAATATAGPRVVERGPRPPACRLRRLCALPRRRLPPEQPRARLTARWGAPEADPFFVDGALPSRHPPLRQRRRRHPARARLRHRPEGDLPRSRPRAAAPLPRLLRLAARSRSPPTRSSTSASTAISNGCPARRSACRRAAGRKSALGADCRSSIRSSSTIPARAARPSGAPRR